MGGASRSALEREGRDEGGNGERDGLLRRLSGEEAAAEAEAGTRDAMAESDWDTVTVLRKKGPSAAQAKSKQVRGRQERACAPSSIPAHLPVGGVPAQSPRQSIGRHAHQALICMGSARRV